MQSPACCIVPNRAKNKPRLWYTEKYYYRFLAALAPFFYTIQCSLKRSYQTGQREALTTPYVGRYVAAIATKMYLGEDLYGKWVAGGMQGRYLETNADSVTFDGRLIDLQNITLDAGERLPVEIELTSRNQEDTALYFNFLVYLRQFYSDSTGTEHMDGSIALPIQIGTPTIEGSEPMSPLEADDSRSTDRGYKLYPNPVGERLYIAHTAGGVITDIRIYDCMGRQLQGITTEKHADSLWQMDIALLYQGSKRINENTLATHLSLIPVML